MTNEELKKKIVEILNDVTTEPMIYKGRYLGDTQMPELKINAIADALIAAGIGNIRETEHRDEVAERTAMVLAKWWANETDYSWKTWFNAAQEQAEEELAEERKDDRERNNTKNI